jgi:hypothetical protein
MSDKISAFSSWFFIETACTFIANIAPKDSTEYISTTSNIFAAVAPELIKIEVVECSFDVEVIALPHRVYPHRNARILLL